METESNISLGGATILLAFFVQFMDQTHFKEEKTVCKCEFEMQKNIVFEHIKE